MKMKFQSPIHIDICKGHLNYVWYIIWSNTKDVYLLPEKNKNFGIEFEKIFLRMEIWIWYFYSVTAL